MQTALWHSLKVSRGKAPAGLPGTDDGFSTSLSWRKGTAGCAGVSSSTRFPMSYFNALKCSRKRNIRVVLKMDYGPWNKIFCVHGLFLAFRAISSADLGTSKWSLWSGFLKDSEKQVTFKWAREPASGLATFGKFTSVAISTFFPWMKLATKGR